MPGQTYNLGIVHTFLAGGAIPAKSAVKWSAIDSGGQRAVVVTTAITEDVIGFALNTAASGEQVDVVTGNGVIVKGICSAGITAGAQVMPTASGGGKVSTAAGATAKSCGIAMSTPLADGDTVEILTRFGVNGPANS